MKATMKTMWCSAFWVETGIGFWHVFGDHSEHSLAIFTFFVAVFGVLWLRECIRDYR